MDKAKLLIAKLLRVAKDDASSQGEIDNALRAARHMMMKYGMNEDKIDVERETAARAEMGKQKIPTTGSRVSMWEKKLAAFVRDFTGSQAHTSPGDSLRVMDQGKIEDRSIIVFYGEAELVAIAVDMFNELRLTIVALARMNGGGWARGAGAGYANGFVRGLFTKLKKAEELIEKESTGLIVQSRKLAVRRQKEADDWLGIKLRNVTSRDLYKDTSLDQRGYRDGSEADLEHMGKRKAKLGSRQQRLE